MSMISKKSQGGGGKSLSLGLRAMRRAFAVAATSVAITASLSASAATAVWNGSAGNGSLSDGGNWDGGTAPTAGDTLDFSGVSSATTLNADFTDERVFATATFGSGVVTMSGDFRVNSLLNAQKLAIPQGASLTVTGDITAKPEPNGTMYFLYSNEGTVTVGGKAIGLGETNNPNNKYSNVYQYQSVNANIRAMRVNGLAYNGTGSARLRMFYGGTTTKWIVGAGGLTFPGSRQANYSTFWVRNTALMLGSSANWTLANVGKAGTSNGDLFVDSGGSLVLDTIDGVDVSTGYTVTLNGRLYLSGGNATIKGCGTVVVATTSHNGLAETTINSGKTLYVTDTATLQVNAGKVIAGAGTVSLASGTKLLVPNASSTISLPSLAPAADSSIVITNLSSGTPAIALTGALTMPAEGNVTLKIGGSTGLAEGIYTVISSSSALPADIVDHLTLDASEVVSGDCSLYAKGGVLFLLVGISEPGYGIWVGGTDTNLSTAANWLNDETPRAGDTLNFKTVSAATTLNGDFEDDRAFATAVFGSGVITLAGSLTVNTLTNATKLAVASGASLTVTGNLVASPTAKWDVQSFLHSNEGTVTVLGKALGYSRVEKSYVHQYETATANTQPIHVGGIAYNCSSPGQLYMRIYAKDNGVGEWVVGAGGISFPQSRQAGYSMFYTEGSGADATIRSSANWTLANSGKAGSDNGDLWVNDSATLTLDTTDGVDASTGYTVTLNGRLYLYGGNATIRGCGTVVIATTSHNGLPETTVASGKTLYVTNGATLQVNAGKAINGAGTISLAAGTTLAFQSSVDCTFTAPAIEPTIALPDEGTATVRIDGEKELKGGDYVLLNSVPAGYAGHLTVTGTAIGDRKAKLKDDGEHLFFSVPHKATVISIR